MIRCTTVGREPSKLCYEICVIATKCGALKAYEKEQAMSRWIDAEWLKGRVHDVTLANGALRGYIDKLDIHEAPSIDIVRCGECKYNSICNRGVQHTTRGMSSVTIGYMHVDFCSYGSRITNAVIEEKPTPIRDYMVYGERNCSEKPNSSTTEDCSDVGKE